ncbi:MAG: branched-chain amino acid transport system permease protein [Baekduia sp.]|jgi:branched-chain amino acid transport system permease protein|nr:branched-chain amino acid transport system permease protein [Baekduia sp.]
MTNVIQNIIDALALGSLYALFALGVALIFGIMRLVNFAHGELIMVAAYTLVLVGDVPFVVKIAAAIAVAIVIALVMERVAMRPVRDSSPTTLLITSFAVSYLLQNLAILILGSTPRSGQVSGALSKSFQIGDVSISKLNVVTIVVTLALLGGLGLFLNRTAVGVQMRAAAENFRMARLLGVPANRVIATAFGISGLLAAIAAIFLTAQTGTVSPTLGLTPVLFAFMATVLGGLGSLSGAVVGGFLLGGASVALQALLPVGISGYRDAFLFGAVLLVLVLRPQGLIVPRTAVTRI